jgi:predicted Zn-dependent peptidase
LNEIAKIRRNGMTSAALTAAKRDLNRQYIAQGETPTGQAGALGFYEMIGDYTFATTYLQRVNAITVTDIKAASQKYLGERNYIEVGLEAAPRTAPPNNDDSQNDGGAAA